MSFLAPSTPAPAAPPSPVMREDEDVAEARRKERLAVRLRKGRASTILTSGAGLAGTPSISHKRLLGE